MSRSIKINSLKNYSREKASASSLFIHRLQPINTLLYNSGSKK
ncbi:hypothetical protein MmTuc01_2650 [Methanosarcina mazei Tuc01]|uniref:Uncharacterized protein n=1 Tax=Methanosarcina mazei Tuc01 TaxID=1236903 RepID=M1Q6M0_METMZ|nr:hypothetical protein MmTuc01_2650 [Methanosarcina mazei Tuc01]